MVRPRKVAFTVIELLTVIAILMILAALHFPVFRSARASADEKSCQANMRQFGVGMALYRSDNDGVGYRYTLPRGIRFPWNWYDGLSEYLKSGSTVWCPLPDDWEGSRIGHGLYHMQVLLDPPGSPQYTSYSVVSEPGRVIVSCGNHARGDYTSSVAERHAGPYIFLREDLSVGKMDSSKIKPYYYNSDWSKFIEQISPGTSYRVYWRFGDEPWPVHKDG